MRGFVQIFALGTSYWLIGLDRGNVYAPLQGFSGEIVLCRNAFSSVAESVWCAPVRHQRGLKEVTTWLTWKYFWTYYFSQRPELDGVKQEPKNNLFCSEIAQLLQRVHFQIHVE